MATSSIAPFTRPESNHPLIESTVLEHSRYVPVLPNRPHCTEVDGRSPGAVPELTISHIPFSEACAQWLEWREHYRRRGTVANYRAHISALIAFFKDLTLQTIMPGHLKVYQEQRFTNEGRLWKRPAGPSYINHELNTLSQMLRVAGHWDRLERFYNPLPLPTKRPQRVMTEDEERQLFEAASENAECYLAYLVASISANTTATGA